jgi:hypothetical protein
MIEPNPEAFSIYTRMHVVHNSLSIYASSKIILSRPSSQM